MKSKVLFALGASLAALSTPAVAGTITITVTDIRNSDGVVRACITAVESAFPRCNRDPNAQRRVVNANGTVTFRFNDVAPGEYAIALLHDENEDGKANRVLGMAPKEGYGFSRDAPVRMAPPSWDDAVFTVSPAAQNLKIKMRYFL